MALSNVFVFFINHSLLYPKTCFYRMPRGWFFYSFLPGQQWQLLLLSLSKNIILLFCEIFYFHTSFAISFTSFNFAHCSSSVSLLPISQEAKPHCGLKYKRSNGTYFAASWILAITSSFFSNAGDLVVTSPRTTFLSPETLAKGAKPPDLSSSYSR